MTIHQIKCLKKKKSNITENVNIIDFINISSSSLKPLIYKYYQCNRFFFMFWITYIVIQTKGLNILSIPQHFGF